MIKKKTLLFVVIAFLVIGLAGGAYYYQISTNKIKADSFTPGVWEESKFTPVSSASHQITWGVLNDWYSAKSTLRLTFNPNNNDVSVSAFGSGVLTTAVLYGANNSAIGSVKPTAGSVSSLKYQYASSPTDIKFTNPVFGSESDFKSACNSQKTAVQTQIILNANQTIHDFRIRATQATFSLSGTVTDQKTGAAISGATVSLRGYSVATDNSGRYQITVPFLSNNSSYAVSMTKGDYNSGSKTITDTCGNSNTASLSLSPVATDDGDTSGGDTGGGDTSDGDTNNSDTNDGDTSDGDTNGSDTNDGDTGSGDTSGGSTEDTGTGSITSKTGNTTTPSKATTTTKTPKTGTVSSIPTTTKNQTITGNKLDTTGDTTTTFDTPTTETKKSLLQQISLWSMITMGILVIAFLIYRYRGVFTFKSNAETISEIPSDLPAKPIVQIPEQASVNAPPPQVPINQTPVPPVVEVNNGPANLSIKEMQLNRPRTNEDVSDMDIG